MGPQRAVTESAPQLGAVRPERASGPGTIAILAPRRIDDITSWLHRLQVLAVVLPVVAILGIHLVRPALESAVGVEQAHLVVGAVSALAVIAFAAVMFAALTRGYRTIVAQHERLARRDRHRAVLGERDRLSREMHDHLAQVLATVQLRLRALPGCCADPEVRRELAEITDLCEESYRDVRESILALRVAGSDGADLLTNLRRYALGCARHTGQQVWIEVPDDADLGMSADAEIQAMRIVQEALANVRKHAGTDEATVRVSQSDAEVLLEIVDEGRGFAADAGADTLGHFGLRTMAERAQLVGGALAVESRPGAGTTVRVRLPRRDAAGVDEVRA